jgi:hypothetical protein
MKSYASMVLGGESRNVEKLGAYVAWLINNRLFQDNIEQAAGSGITRVRMQDLTGADFLSTELHGELKPEQLTEPGRAFTRHYLLSGVYDKDYLQVPFMGDNEWLRYADLAPLISRAYRSFSEPERTSLGGTLAKILKFPARKR